MTTGLPSKNVMLRIRQTTTAARGDLGEPRRMIAGKIKNCRVLLRRNGGDAVNYFVVRAGAVTLTADGRKAAIRAWERRMRTEVRHPMFGYSVSYRRAVELQARILAARLVGELPAYEPLVTR